MKKKICISGIFAVVILIVGMICGSVFASEKAK